MVSSERYFVIFVIVIGLVLAVHCPRAAFRYWRSGSAKGRHGTYQREHDPLRFWGTVIGTGLAGILGLAFLVYGSASIFWRIA